MQSSVGPHSFSAVELTKCFHLDYSSYINMHVVQFSVVP